MAEIVEHCVRRPGYLGRFYYKMQRRKDRKIAKVATERKLLEWTYHILKGRETFLDMEKIADLWGKPVLVIGLRGR